MYCLPIIEKEARVLSEITETDEVSKASHVTTEDVSSFCFPFQLLCPVFYDESIRHFDRISIVGGHLRVDLLKRRGGKVNSNRE